MKDRDFAWNDYNLDKIAKHGVTREEAEHVVRFFKSRRHNARGSCWGEGTATANCRSFSRSTRRAGFTAKLDKDGYPVFNPAEFEALSVEDKDRVWAYYNRKVPRSETRALTPAEQAQVDRALGRRPGRPRIGQGAKVVAVTMEEGFLGRVDAYARKHALKRAEMITRGLRLVMDEA